MQTVLVHLFLSQPNSHGAMSDWQNVSAIKVCSPLWWQCVRVDGLCSHASLLLIITLVSKGPHSSFFWLNGSKNFRNFSITDFFCCCVSKYSILSRKILETCQSKDLTVILGNLTNFDWKYCSIKANLICSQATKFQCFCHLWAKHAGPDCCNIFIVAFCGCNLVPFIALFFPVMVQDFWFFWLSPLSFIQHTVCESELPLSSGQWYKNTERGVVKQPKHFRCGADIAALGIGQFCATTGKLCMTSFSIFRYSFFITWYLTNIQYQNITQWYTFKRTR